MQLNDGAVCVEKIAVVLLLRNNQAYLPYLFDTLQAVETKYDCIFQYYIYENDSTDNTADMCRQFIATRKGMMWNEVLKSSFENNGTAFIRINRIAKARNRLLELSRDYITQCDWCLFIDSDIMFKPETLFEMFSCQPKARNIVMMTCTTLELMPTRQQDNIQYVTESHYYDTFAYVRLDDVMPYPMCCHSLCQNAECVTLRKKDMWHETTSEFDEVRSAWAGFVLIDSAAFQNTTVMWKAIRMAGGESLCEHLYLCDSLRCTTGKNIVKLNNVRIYRLPGL